MTRIVIFAKAPVAGRVKTRLIPALGAEGAAALAREMLDSTLDEALATGLAVELCGEPDAAQWQPARPGLALTAQGEGALGDRLALAAARVLGEERILLIGADCPELGRRRLQASAEALGDHDAVIHPAHDGGYALLGLRRFDRSIFEGIDWSTPVVAVQTVARIEALGWSLHVSDTLRDVDEPGDLTTVIARSEATKQSRPSDSEAGLLRLRSQ
ncbi:MAG TPA: TIGR04282 family arsenosugar biosynthesis glycosyltransferase [Allosphingosinicella sp.]|nr:TIGR04282 family arsenosugar biosynthesis glycosyltransferase [Allosphingosinicella sp.]